MSKDLVWVCDSCLPSGTEIKDLGRLHPGTCFVCGKHTEAKDLNYIDRETAVSLARVRRLLENPHE
jgi:hypothetical protein